MAGTPRRRLLAISSGRELWGVGVSILVVYSLGGGYHDQGGSCGVGIGLRFSLRSMA
jgi:hypothetical protein